MPAANGSALVHLPFEQRWKDEPPTQFQSPSGEQEPEPPDDGDDGEEEEEESDGAGEEDFSLLSPPLALLLVLAGSGAEVEVGEEPPAPGLIASPPNLGWPEQASSPWDWSSFSWDSWTLGPGLGKRMALLSLVVQPLILATNMGGYLELSRLKKSRWPRSSSRFLPEPPPETLIGAQFIYISRSPTRLNQVQERVYLPVGISVGIVKLKWKGSAAF